MKQGHFEEHWTVYVSTVSHAVPAGGVSTGRGFTISWQNGPLGAIDSTDRKEPNGAFVEDVIAACIGRIEFYQRHFPCQENADALEGLYKAAIRLDDRTKDRVNRKVEGEHKR